MEVSISHNNSTKIYAKGYYVSTVGINKATIQKYIREQENEDMISDEITFKEYENPFAHIVENKK